MRTVLNVCFFRSSCFVGLFLTFVLSLLVVSGAPHAQAKPSLYIKVLVQRNVSLKAGPARWSADGNEVTYHVQQGPKASLHRFHIFRNKHKVVSRSANGFFPSFGPAGAIVAGPLRDPKLKNLRLAKRKKRKGKKRKPAGKKKSGKAWWKVQKGQGISLFGLGQEQYLFPGIRPQYSPKARRILFTHRNIMYLWDPLRTRKSGLLLLARGFSPTWAADGRAIAFLVKPFRFSPKKGVSGGGIALVDMLFRASKITKSGGQVTWSADGKTLAWVDKLPSTKGSKRRNKSGFGVFWMSLKDKKRTAHLLHKQAWNPVIAPHSSPLARGLVAFQDHRGVWVKTLSGGKSKLLVPGGTQPRWSSQGDLLVHLPGVIKVIRLLPALRKVLP